MAEASSSKNLETELVKFDYNEETTAEVSAVTSFSWVLKNFEVMMECKKPMQSSRFPLRDDPSIQCFISSKFTERYLEVSAKFFTGGQPGIILGSELYILNHSLGRVYRLGRSVLDIADGFERKEPSFMCLRDHKCYLTSGSLIIGCDIWSTRFSTSFKSKALAIPKSDSCTDFLKLLSDQYFSDFIIVSKGKKFAVHRAILAARSQVFSAMLQHDMAEKKTNTVEIGDAEPEIVSELLRFIYTDNVVNIEKFAAQLLELADRFDLKRLKMLCANELVKSISVSSALEILIIANRHRVNDLEKLTLNFIKNRQIEILDSTNINTFRQNHPELMDRILRDKV